MHRAWLGPLALLGLAIGEGCTGFNARHWPTGFPAHTMSGPPLSLTGRDAQGQVVSLESFRGQVVVVDVWKTG